MTDQKIWTPDEVFIMANNQTRGAIHPYTCANRGDGNHRDVYGDLGALVPTVRGWVCPFCDYAQSSVMPGFKSTIMPTFTETVERFYLNHNEVDGKEELKGEAAWDARQFTQGK